MKAGDADPAVGRRDFLRKAAVAGTGAFGVPMIVTVDPADAQALHSPPPEPPGSTKSEPPAVGVVNRPGGGRDASAGLDRTNRSGRTELPRTGDDIDRLVAAGLAATAGGAALVLWSADLERTSSPTSHSPGPADPEAAT
jgi:hypothetical protein